MSKISKEEEKWQTKRDVELLERYSELISDSNRLAKARDMLKKKNKNINKILQMK